MRLVDSLNQPVLSLTNHKPGITVLKSRPSQVRNQDHSDIRTPKTSPLNSKITIALLLGSPNPKSTVQLGQLPLQGVKSGKHIVADRVSPRVAHPLGTFPGAATSLRFAKPSPRGPESHDPELFMPRDRRITLAAPPQPHTRTTRTSRCPHQRSRRPSSTRFPTPSRPFVCLPLPLPPPFAPPLREV